MYIRTLAAFAMLTLTVTFTGSAQTPQTQPVKLAEQKAPLSDAEVKARADKRKAMQWYVIEPMTACIAGSAKRIREQGEETIDVRYGRYKFRLEATTFEELTGLDSKLTDDLDPFLKEYLKRQIADDLLQMYQKGACKPVGSSPD